MSEINAHARLLSQIASAGEWTLKRFLDGKGERDQRDKWHLVMRTKLRDAAKRFLLLTMFLGVALACANLPENSRRPSNRNTVPTGSAGSADNSAHQTSSWDYSQFEDEMGRGKVYTATVESTNTINLDFPTMVHNTDCSR